MSNVFKAYDIRGIYPEEINKDLAFKVGGATVKFLEAKTLVVGEDCRLSSSTLRGAVIDAATKAGAKVYYIGQCTTPLFYFSVNKLKADGGIMVTASHNPPQYGGLKIVGFESRPVGFDSGLQEIERISNGDIEIAKQEGTVEEVNLTSDYIDFVIKEAGVEPIKEQKLKIVIDAGNGMVPLVVEPLMAKLGINFTPLYFKIDCSFPNHSPDISRVENLTSLRNKVLTLKADLGVAFDGDGDRVIFVDEKGNKIDSGFILCLMFKGMSSFFKKPKVAYDLRFSKTVKQALGNYGFRSRPGSLIMKEFMIKNNLDLGAETSGHYFFKQTHYAESSILVMMIVLKLISKSGKSLSELIKPFEKYFHSGEINIEIQSKEQGMMIIERLKNKYKDGKADELDGITVEYDSDPVSLGPLSSGASPLAGRAGGTSWWFNLRLSNTEPIVRLVVEADTKELMEQKVKELTQEIKKAPQQFSGQAII